MLVHTKKPRTDEKPLELCLIGPAALQGECKEELLKVAQTHGFRIAVEDVPASETEQAPPKHGAWRAAFADLDENRAGTILRGARYREDMTQQDLSKRTGIQQAHLSAMENGTRPIGKMNAKKLAKALNVEDYRQFL